MGQDNRHWTNEADIGSGEKSPGQTEVEREQQALGAQHERPDVDARASGEGGRVLQSGDHLARTATRKLEDGTYEAQVYVRLTREPEVAETYIPVGSFATEEEARAAAQERAERALRDSEF